MLVPLLRYPTLWAVSLDTPIIVQHLPLSFNVDLLDHSRLLGARSRCVSSVHRYWMDCIDSVVSSLPDEGSRAIGSKFLGPHGIAHHTHHAWLNVARALYYVPGWWLKKKPSQGEEWACKLGVTTLLYGGSNRYILFDFIQLNQRTPSLAIFQCYGWMKLLRGWDQGSEGQCV